MRIQQLLKMSRADIHVLYSEAAAALSSVLGHRRCERDRYTGQTAAGNNEGHVSLFLKGTLCTLRVQVLPLGLAPS